MLTGRNKARERSPRLPVAQAAAPKAQPKPKAQPRSLPLAIEMFSDGSWLERMVGELGSAQSVVICSYMFDSTIVCKGLKDMLQKPGTTCAIIVDREHENGTCRYQAGVLQQLRRARAQVYLSYGRNGRGNGSMHIKAVVLDHRIAYFGSANLTRNASNSYELMARTTGPKVNEIYEHCLSLQRKRSTISLDAL